MRSWEICAAIARERLIAIIRADTAKRAGSDAKLLLHGGVRVLEVSLSTPQALDLISDLQTTVDDHVLIGAGTVLDAASARLAAIAGAAFLVTPTLSSDVLRTARRYGLPVVCGAHTPTEALTALELGADMVKVFPAVGYGPSGIRALAQTLPQVPLVPTGGVTLDAAHEYIAAGACAVGIGSELTAGAAAADRLHELRSRLGSNTP